MKDSKGMLIDRRDAGRRLAEELISYSGRGDTIVLGLPRGGVVVAFETAEALNLPLDVFLVRKLGAPGQEELALGAIASGGAMVLNDDVIRALGLPQNRIEAIAARERMVLEQRERLYRGHSELLNLEGKQVILVDDGLATGASMRTAVASLKRHRPRRIVVAVPVAPAETCNVLRSEVDEVVCLMTPTPLYSVGSWYLDFSQTSDDEVVGLLERAKAFGPGGGGAAASERAG